jgi:hypothetical protein
MIELLSTSLPFSKSVTKRVYKSMAGLEPATLRLEVLRAIQLRHTDTTPNAGLEPATTRLRVVRSTD